MIPSCALCVNAVAMMCWIFCVCFIEMYESKMNDLSDEDSEDSKEDDDDNSNDDETDSDDGDGPTGYDSSLTVNLRK